RFCHPTFRLNRRGNGSPTICRLKPVEGSKVVGSGHFGLESPRPVWITSPQLKLIGHVGIRLPPRLRKKFVRNVLVSMRDQDASLVSGIVHITWRRVVRGAGLLRP